MATQTKAQRQAGRKRPQRPASVPLQGAASRSSRYSASEAAGQVAGCSQRGAGHREDGGQGRRGAAPKLN